MFEHRTKSNPSSVSRPLVSSPALAFALLGVLGTAPGMLAQVQPAAQPASPTTQAAPPTQVPSGQPAESEGPQTLHLLVGRSIVISSPARIKRVSLADPNIAEAIVVSPTQVLVNGRTPGGVSLLIWDESDQSQSFEVSVDIDVLGLSQKIHEVFPSEDVHIETSRDVVMLSGKISSAVVADKILEVVKNTTPKVTSLRCASRRSTGRRLVNSGSTFSASLAPKILERFQRNSLLRRSSSDPIPAAPLLA